MYGCMAIGLYGCMVVWLSALVVMCLVSHEQQEDSGDTQEGEEGFHGLV